MLGCYLKIKNSNSVLMICEDKIEVLLNEKKELIDKAIKILNSKKLKDLFHYEENLTIIEKESSLFNIRWELNKYLNNQGKKKVTDEVKDIVKRLDVMEEDLDGLKNFYNANIINYNEIYNKKLFNWFFKLLKLKKKESFKLRKLEDFEILKN